VNAKTNQTAAENAATGKSESAGTEQLPSASSAGDALIKPRLASPSQGNLTVYESGKVVFEIKPLPRGAHSGVELAAKQSAGERAQVSPATADTYLIQRVEPHYPDVARHQHIQGPVVLQVAVNRSGSVQEIQAVSGDSRLVLAAADAVRQWKFKPYAPQGQALNFETRVTVNFVLP
jgi:TonB family protein